MRHRHASDHRDVPAVADRTGTARQNRARLRLRLRRAGDCRAAARRRTCDLRRYRPARSEEHTSELQSLMRISYAVFCLKKKKNTKISLIYKNRQSKY